MTGLVYSGLYFLFYFLSFQRHHKLRRSSVMACCHNSKLGAAVIDVRVYAASEIICLLCRHILTTFSPDVFVIEEAAAVFVTAVARQMKAWLKWHICIWTHLRWSWSNVDGAKIDLKLREMLTVRHQTARKIILSRCLFFLFFCHTSPCQHVIYLFVKYSQTHLLWVCAGKL